ncbi:MAG: hypothetical protein O3B75_05990 [Planctomycetota bacterium]|nr:hypothetical protein [Planctomycetota bacterium]
MSDSTTPSTPDQVRLEKLERTVRRLRRWLWVALIIGIAFLSFVIGRISGSRQMDRGPGMQGPQFNMQGPPQMHGGNAPQPGMHGGNGHQPGPKGGKGSPNDRGEGEWSMQGPPQMHGGNGPQSGMHGGNGPQSGPKGGKGSPNDRGEGKDNGKDKK